MKFNNYHWAALRNFGPFVLASWIACTMSPAFAANYVVRETPVQIAMPNKNLDAKGVFKKGELILDVPLLWQRAILLDSDLTLMIDGEKQIVAAATGLPLHFVGDKDRPEQRVPAFCMPRKAAENKTEKGVLGALLGGGSLWRDLVRSATDRQLCLLDSKNGGSLDSWLLIGDGSPPTRVPNIMVPISYSVLSNVPISSKDRYQVYFNGASGSGKWVEFRTEIMQEGETRKFDTMSTAVGTYSHIERRLRPESGWPLETNFAGAARVITAVEEKGKLLHMTWPALLDTEFVVPIPEQYRVTVRYY